MALKGLGLLVKTMRSGTIAIHARNHKSKFGKDRTRRIAVANEPLHSTSVGASLRVSETTLDIQPVLCGGSAAKASCIAAILPKGAWVVRYASACRACLYI